MSRILIALFLALLASSSLGSHLSEDEVVAMEEACEKLRQEKLAPEKAAVLKRCLSAGKNTRRECEAQAGAYGEIRTGAIRRPGKYYELPECEAAYRAREHFRVNPGR